MKILGEFTRPVCGALHVSHFSARINRVCEGEYFAKESVTRAFYGLRESHKAAVWKIRLPILRVCEKDFF